MQTAPQTYIFNSYQTPNAIIDELQPLLTLEEFSVLSFAIRHILGWRDKIITMQAPISLSQFERTGLSRPTIIKALKGLTDHLILVRIGEATNDGQRWQLCYDNADIAKLEARKADRERARQSRTSKARETRWLVPLTSKSHSPVGGMSDLPTGGKSHSHNKTQDSNTETHIAAPSAAQVEPITERNPLAQPELIDVPKKTPAKKKATERKRDPLFDAIAVIVFGATTDEVIRLNGGRIGKAKQGFLAGKPDATAEDVKLWRQWYHRTFPGTTLPMDQAKIAKHVSDWQASAKKRVVKPVAVAPLGTLYGDVLPETDPRHD